MIANAGVLSWQDIAHSVERGATKVSRRNHQPRGARQVSQETVRQIRADSEAGMTRSEVAAKHHVSPHYVYQVVECGIRDDEREKLR